MELEYFNRSSNKKSETNKLRREGNIPAVIYSKGDKGEEIFVNNLKLQGILRNVSQGFLPTTVFTLKDASGKTKRAVIKDIQYNITNYDIVHLDFEELHDDQEINIKVPIQCQGVVDCVGVKAGGVIRQVIRHLKVRCLPKDIPTHFELDVRELGLRQAKRLKDIILPQQVRPVANMNEVAVTVVKR